KAPWIDVDTNQGLCRREGIVTSDCELLWTGPVTATPARLILAHGAGAPMDSPFMTEMAERLAAQGVRVVRFEFPYMAQRRQGGGKRPPNPQAQLLDCWRAVWEEVN